MTLDQNQLLIYAALQKQKSILVFEIRERILCIPESSKLPHKIFKRLSLVAVQYKKYILNKEGGIELSVVRIAVHTHTHTHTHPHTHTHTLSLSHTHMHSLSLSHTHTHTEQQHPPHTHT